MSYGISSNYSDAYSEFLPSSAAGGAGASMAAKGSGIDWGGAAATAGASALSGIVQEMYRQQQEKKRREAELLLKMGENAQDYGRNQQGQFQQLMSNWNRALGV